ncbi:MAG: aminodeoxychorismate/anthranilate synthase component II [Elusimicrobia bacterium]|nr:aminodeoxychorismate/anthranilate synthase component II [Elusimicrobiota bacterium]
MILLIDNYDSFVYNLYQYIGSINPDIIVKRNDEISLGEIEKLNPEKIILSPGPGKPSDAGICIDVVKNFSGKIPILGVCLGHQAICEAYGATVSYAKELMHGKQSEIEIDVDCPIFEGLNKKIVVGRYHSLAAIKETLPKNLMVSAISSDGEVMAVYDKEKNVYGVQFHPESVLTPNGYTIIKNFLSK